MRSWYIYVSLVCVVAGLLIGWQYNLHAGTVLPAGAARIQELVNVIKSIEEETKTLEAKIEELRTNIDTLRNQTSPAPEERQYTEEQLRWLKQISGLSAVSGPGITIVLDDNRSGAEAAKQKPDYNPENFIIHDKNILYLVNELWGAGAEAIAVNDQRVVLGSEIRCVGPLILVNSSPLAPPYVIKAIGNPESLERAIMSGVEYPYLRYKEFPVSLSKQQDLVLPPFRGSFRSALIARNEGRNTQ